MSLADHRSPLFTAMIDLLVTSPVIPDLLHEHRDDRGRCAVCKVGGDSSSRARYPCLIYRASEAAWTQQQAARWI
jgi:hypothetical protein